ncbi:putative nucleotidyltransferase with HDIG domain [Bradyrhizobium yuanmingense]|uniref:HD domain-containing protein n=1 Tax=Bradyrhizobium yuanmingense TaxID=108015 RepID=UPI003517C572
MNELRRSIIADLPEIDLISHAELREQTIDAWVLALEKSSFKRVSDIPGDANPGLLVLKHGRQNVHLSGVTRLAIDLADHFEKTHSVRIDKDIVIAGGICHDVGKAWECDPKNQSRWSADGSAVGFPSLRHPVYGAYICLQVGLPESVAHIAACHSSEGDQVKRSLECLIVHEADYTWWKISAASGLVVPDTIPNGYSRQFCPRETR